MYMNKTNLTRWGEPVHSPINYTEHPNTGDPTLIRDKGDTPTADGTTTFYFKDDASSTLCVHNIWIFGADFSTLKMMGDGEVRGARDGNDGDSNWKYWF